MTQAHELDPAVPLSPSGLPVFGHHATPLTERTYRRIAIEVEGKRSPRQRHDERWVEEFDCYTEVDGGLWVAIGQARTDMEMARALVTFLGANLRDDDGASMDYVPPALPERADPDDPESDWLRGEPTEDDPDGAPLYLGWDWELYPAADLPKLDELVDGSSRRRFAYISDSMRIRYDFRALEETAEALTTHLTGRPTRRPAPSGHGPQRTGRGSSAKRR